MIIIHAVQKLLNISRLKPALYISEPSPQQELHSRYAKLISTSFRGKLIVMYAHQPSLMIVLTRGKTIAGTMPEFYNRLHAQLIRNRFLSEFTGREMQLAREGYIVSKTNSKSMLASMNAITMNIEYICSTFTGYESVDLDTIENSFTDWMVTDSSKPYGMRHTFDYWKEKGVIQS